MSSPATRGLWHLLGEVEVVFGFWAMVLLVFMVTQIGTGDALRYLESRNFTEPAFVFVIMVIAASRPIIDLAAAALNVISRLLPMQRPSPTTSRCSPSARCSAPSSPSRRR